MLLIDWVWPCACLPSWLSAQHRAESALAWLGLEVCGGTVARSTQGRSRGRVWQGPGHVQLWACLELRLPASDVLKLAGSDGPAPPFREPAIAPARSASSRLGVGLAAARRLSGRWSLDLAAAHGGCHCGERRLDGLRGLLAGRCASGCLQKALGARGGLVARSSGRPRQHHDAGALHLLGRLLPGPQRLLCLQLPLHLQGLWTGEGPASSRSDGGSIVWPAVPAVANHLTSASPGWPAHQRLVGGPVRGSLRAGPPLHRPVHVVLKVAPEGARVLGGRDGHLRLVQQRLAHGSVRPAHAWRWKAPIWRSQLLRLELSIRSVQFTGLARQL
jgi:hypothetical protein